EEQHVVAEMSREQEVLAYVLTTVLPESPCEVGRIQQLLDPVRRPLDRVREDPRVAVRDLERDAADGARDDGLGLPERLRHGESEPLAQALLQNDRRGALQRVDLDVCRRR